MTNTKSMSAEAVMTIEGVMKWFSKMRKYTAPDGARLVGLEITQWKGNTYSIDFRYYRSFSRKPRLLKMGLDPNGKFPTFSPKIPRAHSSIEWDEFLGLVRTALIQWKQSSESALPLSGIHGVVIGHCDPNSTFLEF
jgi:hypothetical protein